MSASFVIILAIKKIMTNGSNKGHRRWPSIFEAATAYDNGNCGYIKPFTNVVVNTNRLWYGKNSTVSAFLATAYDEDGNSVDSMTGYFLEPEHNPDSAKIEGGDKAIMSGTYNIVPKTVIENRINKTLRENGEKEIHLRYDWYIDSVPGRNGIAIHNGNTGYNTSGCFIPGKTFNYDQKKGEFRVNKSDNKRQELFDFFNKYGRNGIKIEVGE